MAAALLLLCGCPQDIQGLGGGGGDPPDAAYAPPACRGGPTVSCTPPAATPWFAMRETQTWRCTLPGPRASDGAAAVLGEALSSDHPEVTLGAKVDSSTGEVTLQPQGVSRQAFTGGLMTAWLTASWDGHPEECTNVPLWFGLAGNLWVADEENGRLLVLDSGGRQVGGALAAEGIAKPRLLAVLKPGEVLVGGKTDGETVLAVFDNEGRRKRVLGKANEVVNPLRAAAGVATFGFISSGILSTAGVLHVTLGDGPLDWRDTKAGGLASDGEWVYLGLVNARGYVKTKSDSVPPSPNDLSYKDSSGKDCHVLGTTAMVHLSAGGFVIASRHAHADTGTDPSPLGHLAWTSGDMTMRAQLPHLHSSLPGSLSLDGPYDWLEELEPGVVVGTRDGKQGVERFEISKIDGGVAPTAWGGTALSNLWLKGLARLK